MSRVRIPLLLLLAALFLALTACQSEGKLTGEVFVVTKGGSNVELGDLKVQAVESSKLESYLEEKYQRARSRIVDKAEKSKPLRDSLEALRKKLDDRRQRLDELEARQESESGASGSYGLPSANQTDVLYTHVRAAFRETRYQDRNLRVVPGELITEIPEGKPLVPIEVAADHYRVSYSGQEGWVRKASISTEEAYERKVRRENLSSEYSRLLDRCQSVRDSLASIVRAPRFRTYEYYFQGIPKPEATDRTDSEGEFDLKLTQGTPYYFLAHRTRSVVDETEEYYWMVEKTLEGESGEVILTNNNMDRTLPDSLDAMENASAEIEGLTDVGSCE